MAEQFRQRQAGITHLPQPDPYSGEKGYPLELFLAQWKLFSWIIDDMYGASIAVRIAIAGLCLRGRIHEWFCRTYMPILYPKYSACHRPTLDGLSLESFERDLRGVVAKLGCEDRLVEVLPDAVAGPVALDCPGTRSFGPSPEVSTKQSPHPIVSSDAAQRPPKNSDWTIVKPRKTAKGSPSKVETAQQRTLIQNRSTDAFTTKASAGPKQVQCANSWVGNALRPAAREGLSQHPRAPICWKCNNRGHYQRDCSRFYKVNPDTANTGMLGRNDNGWYPGKVKNDKTYSDISRWVDKTVAGTRENLGAIAKITVVKKNA